MKGKTLTRLVFVALWLASIAAAVYFSGEMTRGLPTERVAMGGRVGCCIDAIIDPPWEAMALELYAVIGFFVGVMILAAIAEVGKSH